MFSIVFGAIAILSLFLIRNPPKASHHDKVEVKIVEEFEIKNSGNELEEEEPLLQGEQRNNDQIDESNHQSKGKSYFTNKNERYI